MNQVFGQTIAI